MKIDMPKGAAYIIEQLNKSGYEAYIVGGCVRDSLLNKTPNDWDITTDAKPEAVKSIFKRTVDTGIEHGTVTVLIPKQEGFETYEVTTYRIDGKYEDHRRPKEVLFTGLLTEDLRRRDFTINAMAYNDKKGLVDEFGGIEDLKNGIIKCVGNADERFDEDALRILRAVRFAAQLGFEIDDATKEAMVTHRKFLQDISAERIREELTKLLISDNPGRLMDAYELGLTEIILPEFDKMVATSQNNPYHMYDVGRHTIKVVENIMPDTVLRYSALLHDVGKPSSRTVDENGTDHFYGHQEKSAKMAREILRRLKFDNNTIDMVCRLVTLHDYGLSGNVQRKNFRRFLGRLGKENFGLFMALRKADMAGQSTYKQDESLASVEHLQTLYKEVLEQGQCISMSELAIGGKDLIALGMKPGREIGEMLSYLLDCVLDDPALNTREQLIEIYKTHKINA